MATKKRYPEPFNRAGKSAYYFTYTDREGKRRLVSTGETGKEKARVKIRERMEAERAETSELTFADYAKPFFRPSSCPHYIRLKAEGKSIGLTHLAQCRVLLDHHLLKDKTFASLPIAKIKRRDLLDLRRRLQADGKGENTVNKVIATAKTILSEAAFREDIDSNPGAEVGEIKYTRHEHGVFEASEVVALFDFLTERTARLKAEGKGTRPIKPGASQARAKIAASLAVRDEASKGKDGLGLPKWGKTREIFLANVALSRLKAWRDVFVSEVSAPPPAKYFVFAISTVTP